MTIKKSEQKKLKVTKTEEKKGITKEDIIQRAVIDFPFYAYKNLKIRTVEGKLLKFKLNKIQVKLDKTIEKQRALNKPVRLVILKARQEGVSTYTEGKFFQLTSTQPNIKTVIMAHIEDSTTLLFNMSKLFLDELPTEVIPMVKSNNKQELLFENPTNDINTKKENPGLKSNMRMITAKGKSAGRGGTIQYLHISELAFMPSPKETMLGVMQSVPNTSNSIVIVESTANGIGDYFYELYTNAKKGLNDFIPIFFAWFEHEDYQIPLEEGEKLELTDEEIELQLAYNLSPEQIKWRRWSIRNNCNGDEELFKQEYPSNDNEAFLSSGRPVFNHNKCEYYKNNKCKIPLKKGNLIEVNKRVQFNSSKKGYLSIWEFPIDGQEYIISVDTAEGLKHGDYSCADVLNRRTKEQAAQFHGHIDPDLFAKEIEMLARFYNRALVVPELNNTSGGSFLSSLKPIYKNIYKRKENVDSVTNKTIQEYGWRTMQNNRKLIIDNLIRMFRDDLIKINCKETIEEFITFVYDDKGKPQAQSMEHDDRVMSLAINAYVDSQKYYNPDEANEIDDYEEYRPVNSRTGY